MVFTACQRSHVDGLGVSRMASRRYRFLQCTGFSIVQAPQIRFAKIIMQTRKPYWEMLIHSVPLERGKKFVVFWLLYVYHGANARISRVRP